MRRRDFIFGASAGLLASVGISGSFRTPFSLAQSSPPEYMPNDPAFIDQAVVDWARQLNLPRAWYLEKHSLVTPLVPQVIIAQLDGFVDATVDDLRTNTLDQYRVDLTGAVSYEDSTTAGTSNVGLMVASGDNALRVAGIAGLSGRVKAIPVKIIDGQATTTPAKFRAGLQAVLDRLDMGLPIVVIACSIGGPDDNPGATRALLAQLAKRGVYVVTSAGQGGLNLDSNPGAVAPACYSTDPDSNVIAVGGINSQDNLTSFSNWGQSTVDHVALGQNVPVTFQGILDPNRTASATGMRFAASQVAAAYAMVRLYRTADPVWAAWVLKQTVRKVSGLQGKIGSGGVVDLYAALTATGVPVGPLQLLMEQTSGVQSTAAVAVDSVLGIRDPFRVINHDNRFNDGSVDKNTRIVILVANLQLLPGENQGAVGVVVTDSSNHSINLLVEDVRPTPDMAAVAQVTVRLADNLPNGALTITVNLHGQSSNPGTVRIR